MAELFLIGFLKKYEVVNGNLSNLRKIESKASSWCQSGMLRNSDNTTRYAARTSFTPQTFFHCVLLASKINHF